MIRKDREIKDINEILKIVEECHVCHLAMAKEGKPYVVPLNFGYTYENHILELYFHCGKSGKKLDTLKKNPSVFFSMEAGGEVIPSEIGCKVGYKYRSVMGEGEIEFVENPTEKINILENLLFKFTKKEYNLLEKEVGSVVVLRLRIKNLTAKGRKE